VGAAAGPRAAIRKGLNDAGAEPRLDEYAEDPAETVPRELVIDLYAQRLDAVGRRLGVLLEETRGG